MCLIKEVWKDIEGYEGLYQVSNFGNVKSLNYKRSGKEKILKPCKNNKGYFRISLSKNGNVTRFFVHKLVTLAFIPNPDNLSEVNHKNEIKTDNRVENLEFCTHEYNNCYGSRLERVSKSNTKPRPYQCKPILQYTLDGNFIREWESIKQASEKLNISSCYICNYLKGRNKMCGDFCWKYK